MTAEPTADLRRQVPRTDALLADPRLVAAGGRLGRALVKSAVQDVQQQVRTGRIAPADAVEAVLAVLPATAGTLRPVLNATGVLVHTNLGRAPLSAAAVAAVVAASGTTDVELDLATGRRGPRGEGALAARLAAVPAAEAALVVNNCAAALALVATALGGELVIARGELVEIGDGFRIPDVLARSGARMVEVGTTNRTRATDYERAIGPEAAALLRVHQSNYRIVGFTEAVPTRELARIASAAGLPLVDDLGSGSLLDLGDEPTAAASVAEGADLVCFSGDKLLGGPQAGIVVGRSDLVERLRRHPLQRALRADKLTLAALEGTLALLTDPELARAEIPVLRMLDEPAESVRERAERLAGLIGGEVEETVARVGGGALPLAELESAASAIEESLAPALRLGDPPVVGLVRDGRLLLDARTLTADEIDEVARAVLRARRASISA
jgi:L-seryl-tRNA(Ser) seleniumtransferase